ncbi:MAG TPA: hypothetical protein VLF94_00810 [Chlamydiales bacterium]|nr:hypothetical protein [Chlamydiales bacterium]
MFVQRVYDRPLDFMDVPIHTTPCKQIQKVALSCFRELVVAMTIGSAIAIFIPMPMGVAVLISSMAIQCATSFIFHSLGAFAARQVANGKPQFEKLVSVCEWWTGENFALLTGVNAQMLVHETGHSLAAYALYKTPRPRVEIMPFEGGYTTYYKTPVGFLGKKIGPVATTMLVVASGPAFTLLVSSLILAVGLVNMEKHPRLAKYLISWGVLDFVNHAHYAYSTLSSDPSNLAHDFVHLSIFGLNPTVAAISLLAIPIVITAGIHWWKRKGPEEPALAIHPRWRVEN